jgi:PIN domain nuclease of toxin-antitoxin system
VEILADTRVWFRFVRRLPLPRKIEAALNDISNRRYLCPISSMEIVRKWQIGKLPCPDPNTWLDLALEGLKCFRSRSQLIAATAQRYGIELWHTNKMPRKITGFPQRYFKGVML